MGRVQCEEELEEIGPVGDGVGEDVALIEEEMQGKRVSLSVLSTLSTVSPTLPHL